MSHEWQKFWAGLLWVVLCGLPSLVCLIDVREGDNVNVLTVRLVAAGIMMGTIILVATVIMREDGNKPTRTGTTASGSTLPV